MIFTFRCLPCVSTYSLSFLAVHTAGPGKMGSGKQGEQVLEGQVVLV